MNCPACKIPMTLRHNFPDAQAHVCGCCGLYLTEEWGPLALEHKATICPPQLGSPKHWEKPCAN